MVRFPMVGVWELDGECFKGKGDSLTCCSRIQRHKAVGACNEGSGKSD